MQFPRSIGFRIILGFGLLIVAIILNAFISSRIVERVQSTQQQLSLILEPSIRELLDFQSLIHQSKDLVQTWEYTGRDVESAVLNELRYIMQNRLPLIHQELLRLSESWKDRDREDYENLYHFINDTLDYKTTQFTSNLYLSDNLNRSYQSSDLNRCFEYTDSELENLIIRFDRLEAQAGERTEVIYKKTMNLILILGVIITLAAILIAVLLYMALVNPIKQYTDTITSMGKGVIPDREFRKGPDEMGQIGIALNNMIKGLGDLAEFSEEIGKGNFKSEFSPLSDKDILGNSLIQLREDLQNAAIEDLKRKDEDERRNWSNQGIARFNEILREYSGDSGSLATKLISELVTYLAARVGGIFLINTGNETLGKIELISSYAYDRRKHIKKNLEPGEGLVGRCIQEGSTIFMTDIPPNYIKIKSGLGEDNPKSLLIVPIRLTDIIIGVIEIASLEIIQEYKIEFVERIGSTIASSLSGKHTGTPKSNSQDK